MPATSSRWRASQEARTGDTLCDPNKPVILEKMEFPEAVIEIAIEPKSKADQEKLGVALAKLAAEDPSFRCLDRPGVGPDHLKGMGELHLDIKVDILKRTYKVDANIARRRWRSVSASPGAPRCNTLHKKQTGGTGQYAKVSFIVEPNEPGKGFEFESKIVGGAVPKEVTSRRGKRASRGRADFGPSSPASRWSTSR